jgi:pimeloyl-ACP methyl ester carboxylesterase
MTTAIRFNQIATREEGTGVPVVLLHGSTSDSRQWKSFTGYIAGRYRVIAPDLPGYGKSRAAGRVVEPTLSAQAAALFPLLSEGAPVHLVGHSFGGAVALKAACMFPGHVRSLTLIEPMAANVLWTERGYDIPETRELLAAVRSSATALAEGDAWDAMRRIVDFWNGDGAWERTSFGLRQTLAAQAGRTHDDFAAIAADETTAIDLAGVVCPVLSLRGAQSPAVTGAIADHMHRTLPFVRRVEVADAGHMLPLTDPHIVDPMIGDFLARVDRGWQDAPSRIALAA